MAADRRGHVAKLSAAKRAATSFVEPTLWKSQLPRGLHDFQGMRGVIWAPIDALSRFSSLLQITPSSFEDLVTLRDHMRAIIGRSRGANGEIWHQNSTLCCCPRWRATQPKLAAHRSARRFGVIFSGARLRDATGCIACFALRCGMSRLS
jgi:hypothetical protein